MPKITIFTDPYGKSRKGYQKVCPICNQKFFTRISQDYRCCSHYCKTEYSKLHTKIWVELNCANCNKVFKRRKNHLTNSKSGLYFCDRKCKEFAQSLKGGLKAIQPSHYGTAGIDYRSLFAEHELVCKRCGYNEFRSCVDIHHIDEDRNNNDKSNLIPLCCNCHLGLHRGAWKFEHLNVAKSGIASDLGSED